MYGDNEAEQRIKEYKEQLKSSAKGFAEVVYVHEYKYNGYRSFQEFATDEKNENWYLFSYSRNDALDFCSDFYVKIDNVEFSGTDTRDNNPYYALNFWHSYAAIVYDA